MSASVPWIVTKTEFAQLVGVSQPMVSKLVSQGKLGAGLRSDGRIDVVLGCRNAGYRLPARPGAAVSADGGGLDLKARGAPDDADAAEARSDRGVDLNPDDPVSDDMQAARLLRLQHQARQAELDTAEREGRLVDRAAVDRAVETKARRFRDAMLGVPARVADECARLTDPMDVEAVVEAAIEAALKELAKEGDDAV